MFCNHCGKENKDNSTVCAFCGKTIQETPLEFDSNIDVNSFDVQKSFENVGKTTKKITENIGEKAKQTTEKIKSNKKQFKKLCLIFSACLIIVIAIIISSAILSSQVSIKNYILDNPKYAGVNGYGYIDENSEIINWEGLYNKLMGNKKASENSSDNDSYNYSYGSYKNMLSEYITILNINSSQLHCLSNGDKIKLTVNIDNEGIKKRFSKSIKEKELYEFEYVVSGLKDGLKLDLFDAVDCYIYDNESWENQDGLLLKNNYDKEYQNGDIHVKNNNSYYSGFSVNISGDGLDTSIYIKRYDESFIESNTKTVKFVLSEKADRFIENGIILSPEEKDIKIVKLNFVNSDSIKKADISLLTAKANDYARKNFPSSSTLSQIKLYFGNDLCPVLSYFYKTTEGYKVVYYEGLKTRNDNSGIYNIDEIEANSHWDTYESISKFEEYSIDETADSCSISIK